MDTRAFGGSNPTDEPITSCIRLTWEQQILGTVNNFTVDRLLAVLSNARPRRDSLSSFKAHPVAGSSLKESIFSSFSAGSILQSFSL
jgi:hypothetical protein